MTDITTHIHKNENADSIELGTPAKGGAIKVYLNFDDPVACREKILKAIEMRKFGQAHIEVV